MTVGPFRNPPAPSYRTYEVLKEETANPRVRWAYLPYSMHMAGPREVSAVGGGAGCKN